MKYILLTISVIVFLTSCSKKPEPSFKTLSQTKLLKVSIDDLPNYKLEDYDKAIKSFINSCKSKKTKQIYKNLCQKAKDITDSKKFFSSEFEVYKIISDKNLLTGYYEASLKGSLTKKYPYIYPIYEKPNNLVNVDLSSIYPELKNYRLRGRVVGQKLVPYFSRAEINSNKIDANIICYTDSKIDLFFLEVQGSGRVLLDNGKTIFVGYANQNGHKYNSIGKYLISIGAIKKEDISLQSIKKYLKENPNKLDEVLNYNKSFVFFAKRSKSATGSLGLELTPLRSIAVDRKYIPLGTMLYLDSTINGKRISQTVMAQDTGGAIKGSVRADMFLGYGEQAKESAGMLKSDLSLWIFMPKEEGNK